MTSIAATTSAPNTAASQATATRAPQGASTAAQPSNADVAAAQAQLDAPDPTYPALTALHVGLLQAMGTPATKIAEIAARKPDAAWLDSYIQDEIMQNPEGWDDYVGNPRGTARAGLAKVLPDAVLPAPGSGVGTMPSDSSRIPGITTPLLDPGATPTRGKASDSEKLVRNVVWGAVAVGVGVLAWKFMKGHGAAAVAKEGAEAIGGGGATAAKGGIVNGIKNIFRGGGAKAGAAELLGAGAGGTIAAGGNIASMGMSTTARAANHMLQVAIKADNPVMFNRAVTLGAFAEGGAERAATVMSILTGAGPVNGHVAAAGFGAAAVNVSVKEAADIALNALRVEATHVAAAAPQAAASGAEVAAMTTLAAIQRIVT